MADVLGDHHRSVSEHADKRPADSSNRTTPNNRNGTSEHEHEKPTLGVSMSRRTLRQSRSMIPERKAYPLPDPSQFETSPSSGSDPSNDILYPMQSLKRFAEREHRETTTTTTNSKVVVTNDAPTGEKQPAPKALVKQPVVVKAPVVKSNCAPERSGLGSLPEDPVPSTTGSSSSSSSHGHLSNRKESKVVVVYDAEKKFTTGAVDVALREFAIAEGDAIVVLAFLEHIMSPMGMRMVADLKQFSGVNGSILTQMVLLKKREIESKLKDTNRSQHCETKKIQLDVKVLPGSNPKALVAKDIIDFQATCAIFDKNAMKNRKYYEERLSCHLLRLRSDGLRVETISLFGQGGRVLEKTGSLTSHCSDSSSDSSMNSDSPSIWSKLKLFGSKRSTGPLGSSRTSSSLGSPRVHEDEPIAEVLEESFSFDSPKPNPAEAYVYAAAGLDKFGSYTRSRNGETKNLPTALAA